MTQRPTVRPSEAARMLSVADVASLLNVSISTVRRLIERDDLRAYTVAGTIRIRGGDLTAFLKANEVNP